MTQENRISTTGFGRGGIETGKATRKPESTETAPGKIDLPPNVQPVSERFSIYEEGGKTILATLKPTTLLAMFNAPQLKEVAQEVEDTIVKIMNEATNAGSSRSLLSAK